MTEYRHTADMGEISGFGGGYEAVCQDMLHAGVSWLKEKKIGADDIKAHTYTGVYGLIEADNPTAKELEKVLLDAAHGDCTGAMMQAVMSRCIWLASHTWEQYCAEMRHQFAEEEKLGKEIVKRFE